MLCNSAYWFPKTLGTPMFLHCWEAIKGWASYYSWAQWVRHHFRASKSVFTFLIFLKFIFCLWFWKVQNVRHWIWLHWNGDWYQNGERLGWCYVSCSRCTKKLTLNGLILAWPAVTPTLLVCSGILGHLNYLVVSIFKSYHKFILRYNQHVLILSICFARYRVEMSLADDTAEGLLVRFDGEMTKLHNMRAYEAGHLIVSISCTGYHGPTYLHIIKSFNHLQLMRLTHRLARE